MDGMDREALQFLIEQGSKTKGYVAPTVIEDDGVPYMIVPQGCQVVDAEHLLPNPVRVKLSQEFVEAESFCEYVNDHKTDDTHVYASMDKGTVMAVIDHSTRTANEARWGRPPPGPAPAAEP